MALIERFVGNEIGGITFTGNTLGLGRSATPGVPGTIDNIGAFITTDTSLQFGSYPQGTTNDFNLNSSSANLNLPAGSNVLYAELIWGGTYIVGGDNFSAFIDKSVNFITPDGELHLVSPDPVTSFSAQVDNSPLSFIYTRSANVTSIVQASGGGTYTAGGIVGTLTIPSDTNCCSWTLTVAYENTLFPFRNLSLFIGGVIVNSNTTVTTTISGFGTPTSGPVSGRLSIAALEGDANFIGEQLYFGPDVSSLTRLSGPNNFPLNFFASQINNDEGLLDTTGTFGTRNQINGSPGTNVVGGRQGLDITNIDVSGQLINNQTGATIRFLTTDEAYLPIAFGLQIDINAPEIEVFKSANVSEAILGEIIIYTVNIENTGTADADVRFVDPLSEGTSFVEGSVVVNSVSVPGANPVTGFGLGVIPPGGIIELSFQVVVDSIPPSEQIINESRVDFTYQSVSGGPILDGSVSSNTVIIPLLIPSLNLIKTAVVPEAVPGESILYTLEVQNTGPLPLTNIVITDSLFGFQETISILDPGTSTELSFVFVVPVGTPAGTVIQNTATATADGVGPVSDDAFITVLSSYELSITKTPDRFSANPGETLTYTLVVTNESNTQLTNIEVSDTLTGFSTLIPSLERLESSTIDITYTVPPGVTAGSIISNVATAFTQVTGPASDTAEIVVGAIPDLLILKTVSQATAAPGEVITYTITVANEGNSALTNVHVTDPSLEVDETFNLNIGDSVQLEIPFTVPVTAVQGEVITNIASVISDQVGPESANAEVVVLGQSSIRLTKTVVPESASPGTAVTYSFLVQNTGTTPLENVQLTDLLLGLIELIGDMAAGEVRTITFSYDIPDDAIEPIINTGLVTGNFGAFNVSDEDEAVIDILLPAFTLSKFVQPVQAIPGQTVTFTYTVANTGGIPLTNIVLIDPLLGFTDTLSFLAPGASESGTIPFIIPEGTPAGTVFENVLTATPLEIGAQEARATVTVSGTPAISLIKTADVSTALPGEVVTFTITVTNVGNQPVTSVGIGDDLIGLDEVIPTFGILETQTFVVPYTIPIGTPIGTIITNISTAVSNETESIEAIAHVVIGGGPFSIDLIKTATPTTAAPGDTIQYAITITNPNTIPLTDVFLVDELLDVADNLGTFAPGEARTLGFNLVIPIGTEGGTILTNTSFVNSNETDQVAASAIVTVTSVPGLELNKVFSLAEGRPGQIVTVIVTLNNTGNIDLTNVLLSDTELNFELVIPVLPVGASQVISIPFIIPPLEAGTVLTNTAIVASDQTVEISASADLTILAAFAAIFTKSVDRRAAAPGETVTFTYVFENQSNAPLTNVRFEDRLIGIVQIADELAPNIRIVGSRTFTVPPGTLAGTILLNLATIESTELPLLEAEAALVVADSPSFALRKVVKPLTAVQGQEVMFFLSGINTGNVALQDIRFSDPLLEFQGILANVEPGSRLSVALPFVVPPGAEIGDQIVNTLFVTAPGLPPQEVSAAVTVAAHQLSIVKEASTTQAFVGDSFRFTIRIRNMGAVEARDIVVNDALPDELQFVPGSVLINGATSLNADPRAGIVINHLAPGQTLAISFQVSASFLTGSQRVRNQASASFFLVNSGFRFSMLSNSVVIQIDEHEE